MAKISIDKAEPGMVVTDGVTNDKGMILLPPGTELSETLINRLKKWNVQTVTVKGDSTASGESEQDNSGDAIFQQQQMDEELEQRIEKKFEPVMNDPVMADIYKALKIFLQNG